MDSRRRNAMYTCLGWIGDMRALNDYLLTRPWGSAWAIAKAANAILRSTGAVAFASSPFTGLLILIGMFVGNASVAWACIFSGIIAIICSQFLNQPEESILSGGTILNSILLGCVSVAAFPGTVGHPLNFTFWMYLAVALVLTSFVDKGLNDLMAASCRLPALSLPFNFMGAIFFLTLRTTMGTSFSAVVATEGINALNNTATELDWFKVWEGTILSAGQIYGVGTMDASILIFIGYFLYSPLITAYYYMGSVIGSIVGIVLGPGLYAEVYAGLWGYNSLLTAGAVSYFFAPTPQALIAAVVGSALTAAVQASTVHLFTSTAVPVMSYPFNIASILILAIAKSENTPFVWVKERSFPERHALNFYTHLRKHEPVSQSDAEPEELLEKVDCK